MYVAMLITGGNALVSKLEIEWVRITVKFNVISINVCLVQNYKFVGS